MYKLFFKRVFDLILVLLSSPVWLIIFLILTMILYFTKQRPIFYIGDRMGYKNKIFKIIKFRTLLENSGSETSGDTVGLDDKRQTYIGKFLRLYKLDELPQLFLILIGEMSIVGPRPELPIYVDKEFYEKKNISSCKPGLTDYSTIKFFELSKIVKDKKVNEYVENFILKKKNILRAVYAKKISFCTDVKIIFLTLKMFFK